MKTVPTFIATIYVGLKDTEKNYVYHSNLLKKVCQDYCDKIGLCVTFTNTEYIYTNGFEPGLIIGLINYPRFPSDPENIKEKSIELAKLLLKEAKQYKVCVILPSETIMIEKDDVA